MVLKKSNMPLKKMETNLKLHRQSLKRGFYKSILPEGKHELSVIDEFNIFGNGFH